MTRPGAILYKSQEMSARFVDAGSQRIVVSFPDRVHPTGFDVSGWGESFFQKRGISAIYIALNSINWFQTSDFFEALEACRAKLGPDRDITTYGSSMGGYAALMGAKALRAKLCIAASPQFSIDPKSVPFERRYTEYAAQVGTFAHDIQNHASPNCHYVIAYDPCHRLDSRHVALIEKSYPITRLPVYRSGHGVLRTVSHGGNLDTLASVLTGEANVARLRQRIRDHRNKSKSYLMKMGRHAKARKHKELFDYDAAIAALHKGNKTSIMPRNAVSPNSFRKLVVHCGLPKTGTTSLQAYFANFSERYQALGVYFPTDGKSHREHSHAWFSRELRQSSVERVKSILKTGPDGCDTLFLSDESLFVETPGLTPATQEKLSAALKNYEVELVLCLRDQNAWMRSFYLQSVKNRRAGPRTKLPSARNLWQTSDDYHTFFQQEYCQRLLNFEAMEKELSQLFVAASVTTLQFEPGQDIVQSFCEALEWPHFKNSPALALNPSLSDSQAEILRQANAMKGPMARFIKASLELPDGFDPTKMRRKRLEKLAVQAQIFPWEKLEFKENPPLTVTQDSFDDAKEALRQKAQKLIAAQKAL